MKVSEVKLGDILIADGGFDCLKENQHCEVKADGDELYVECSHGKHFLEGQCDFETGTKLVGLTLAGDAQLTATGEK